VRRHIFYRKETEPMYILCIHRQ